MGPDTALPEPPEPESVRRKNPVVALLSLVLSGLGHLYIARARRGILLFSGEFLLTALFFTSPIALSFMGLILFVAALLSYKVFVVTDSVLINRKTGAFERKKYNRPLAYLGLIVLASVLSAAIDGIPHRVEAFKIPSTSMVPTVIVGDHIMVDEGAYREWGPQRGDIIVFTHSENGGLDLIKRCVAVGGDRMEIRSKALLINGIHVDEPYAVFTGGPFFFGRDNLGPFTVPEGSLFVLGDNRDSSRDSRYFGPVDVADVKGKARFIYWSWDRENRRVRWERIGLKVR